MSKIFGCIFELFQASMFSDLRKNGRRELFEAIALEYAEISVPFNIVALACLASLASYASAETLFSELERFENNHEQSLLTSKLEISEIIRTFKLNEVRDIRIPKNGLLLPEVSALKCLVEDLYVADKQQQAKFHVLL